MKNRKPWLFLGLVVLVLIGNSIFGWSDYLANQETLPVMRRALEDNFALALLLYGVLTVAGCVLLALPGVTFAIVAGVLFGPVWGTLACWLAVTLGACLSFLAGRYFLKDTLKPQLEKNSYLNRLLFAGAGQRDVFLLAITRLVPLFPYNLQNFAYGITDIRFLPYALYSALFMLPGTAAYTVGAAGVASPERRGLYLMIAGALLALVLTLSFILKKKGVKV
ncbi:SNARE-like domain protein [Desulfitobacterium hafniense DP7]|nr:MULTISPECIES: VTT domain-containing protein [Desulfitobacterium]EHL07044.1 SNARE-like domain protein [Desulfitobacterium hafniense DP7]